MTQPDLVLENRFHAPPAFVKSWLTDYRADDGRFFGDAIPFRVERKGHTIRRTQDNAMGTIDMTVDVQRDDRWVVEGAQTAKDGSTMFSFEIVESVQAIREGTLHRVEMRIKPSPALAAALPQMIEQWRAMLTAGFAVMAKEIGAQAKAGAPPVA